MFTGYIILRYIKDKYKEDLRPEFSYGFLGIAIGVDIYLFCQIMIFILNFVGE